MQFDHEKLTVYHRALDFLGIADAIASQLPQGRHVLKDQLQRASISIVANIAEGAGEFSKAEKRRFYRIAKRSGTESAALIDIVRKCGLAPEDKTREARLLLLEIVAMLTKLSMSKKVGSGMGRGMGTGKGSSGLRPLT